jgi:hypothetical protein
MQHLQLTVAHHLQIPPGFQTWFIHAQMFSQGNRSGWSIATLGRLLQLVDFRDVRRIG